MKQFNLGNSYSAKIKAIRALYSLTRQSQPGRKQALSKYTRTQIVNAIAELDFAAFRLHRTNDKSIQYRIGMSHVAGPAGTKSMEVLGVFTWCAD